MNGLLTLRQICAILIIFTSRQTLEMQKQSLELCLRQYDLLLWNDWAKSVDLSLPAIGCFSEEHDFIR